MRRILAGLVALSVACGGLAALAAQDPPGQEPPVRLKKKARPQTEPPPEKDKKPDTPPRPAEPPRKPEDAKDPREQKDEPPVDAKELEQKIAELMNRVSKNLRTAEDRLDKKDPGDGTQQAQLDVEKDLDDLIEQTRRALEQQDQQQQQQQQSTPGMPQQGQQRQGQQQQQRQRQQQARGRQRMRQRQMARRQQQRQQQQQGQPDQPQEDQTQSGAQFGQSSKKDDMNKIADLYKDIWGHLPETVRQEMNQYSREQFMAKYSELLKQYYATIAEKGRKKGD